MLSVRPMLRIVQALSIAIVWMRFKLDYFKEVSKRVKIVAGSNMAPYQRDARYGPFLGHFWVNSGSF